MHLSTKAPLLLLHEFGATKDEWAAQVAHFSEGRRVIAQVERFDRRGTEPFELFRPEFAQHSVKIQEFSLENSKISGNFNIFKNIGETPTNFYQTLSLSNIQ